MNARFENGQVLNIYDPLRRGAREDRLHALDPQDLRMRLLNDA
ncbi:MAG: hypothetical protein AB7P69_01265 [Candidatus Binatia bacterium]